MAESSGAAPLSWEGVLGRPDDWLELPLTKVLKYEQPLPVQRAVVPIVSRAIRSGFPMDICLSAPTGSGKTLCYLIPMLQMLTDAKSRNVDLRQLRALVLVPTKQLGEQVARELRTLCRGTTIQSLCLCGSSTSGADHVQAFAAEQKSLVREVRIVKSHPVLSQGFVDHSLGMDAAAPPENRLEARYFSQVDVVVATPKRFLRHVDSTRGLTLRHMKLLVIDEADQVLTGSFAAHVVKVLARYHDEVAAQERAWALSEQPGGAVDVVGERQRTSSLHKLLCSATLSTRIARISEVRLRNCRYFALTSAGEALHSSKEGGSHAPGLSDPLLAWDGGYSSSSSSSGEDDDSSSSTESDADAAAGTRDASAQGLKNKKKRAEVEMRRGKREGQQSLIRTAFALPPRLQEHVIFVKDSYRHAVLLKLVRQILSHQRGVEERRCLHQKKWENQRHRQIPSMSSPVAEHQHDSKHDDEGGAEEPGDEEKTVTRGRESGDDILLPGFNDFARGTRDLAPDAGLPQDDGDNIGNGILIFCSTADEARVMGHFLLASGIQALEFTTTTTEEERRRVLLDAMRSGSAASGTAGGPEERTRCVVASDALMRGIDIPDVGHIIMYNPPANVSQYVHRAGRTARATRAGHVYVLVTKEGSETGKLEDGEMAHFKKKVCQVLSRTRPIQYERGFFHLPLEVPSNDASLNAQDGHVDGKAVAVVPKCKGKLKQTAEQSAAMQREMERNAALIDEANAILMRSQLRLRAAWTSAMSSQIALQRNTDGAASNSQVAPAAPSATTLSNASSVGQRSIPIPTHLPSTAHPGADRERGGASRGQGRGSGGFGWRGARGRGGSGGGGGGGGRGRGIHGKRPRDFA